MIDINMLSMLESDHIQSITIDVDLYYAQYEYDWSSKANDYVRFDDLTGEYMKLTDDYKTALYRNVPNSLIVVTKCYYDNNVNRLKAKALSNVYNLLDFVDTEIILLTDDTGEGT